MKKKKILLILGIVVLVILIDQLSKFVIDINFRDQSIGSDMLGIEVTTNTGLALGFNSGNIRNIGLSVFVIILIANFMIKQFDRIDTKTAIAVALVLGGGISNVIDRIFRGSVLDFIRLLKIPNFNMADAFIVVGWIMIVIFLIIYTRKEDKTSA